MSCSEQLIDSHHARNIYDRSNAARGDFSVGYTRLVPKFFRSYLRVPEKPYILPT